MNKKQVKENQDDLISELNTFIIGGFHDGGGHEIWSPKQTLLSIMWEKVGTLKIGGLRLDNEYYNHYFKNGDMHLEKKIIEPSHECHFICG
jgi:hypothetical protein